MCKDTPMYLFVDFDDTIFNTRKGFFTALRDAFVRGGVPAEMVDRTYAQCTAQQRAAGLHYTPQAHVDFLRAEGYALLGFEGAYDQLLSHMPQWVYKDFTAFAAQCDVSPIILSYGDATFQHAKISASGVAAIADDVIVTQGKKAAEIARHATDTARIAVVVDNIADAFPAVKALRRPTHTVHVLRGGASCQGRTCDTHITSFADLCAILQEIR